MSQTPPPFNSIHSIPTLSVENSTVVLVPKESLECVCVCVRGVCVHTGDEGMQRGRSLR